MARASQTVSAVIFGVALSTLLVGRLANMYPVRPFIVVGGGLVAGAGLLCSVLHDLNLFIALRFVQGLCIPALTTCLATYLARNLPLERLNVVMGSYVSATVIGGLGGRLLGGWIHPPLHWRYAFVMASVMVLTAALAAGTLLPSERKPDVRPGQDPGFLRLMARPELIRTYVVGFGAMFLFASVFNYMPFS